MNKTEVYEELSAVFEYENTPLPVLVAGLCSEAGEVAAEWLKEAWDDRPHTDTTEAMLDELSDVLWYVTRLAARKGATLESLMRRSLIKLEDRQLRGKK